MGIKHLSGPLKVAILVQTLGAAASRKILSQMSASERSVIENHIAKLHDISPDVREKVAMEFMELFRGTRHKQIAGSRRPGGRYHNDSGHNLIALESRDPEDLAEIIREEHPQTIAMILVHLRSEIGSAVLEKLPEKLRADVALRIATSTKFSPEMIDEMNKVFEDMFREKTGTMVRGAGGAACLADMLNQIDPTIAAAILDNIDDSNPNLSQEIKQKMFVFDDIALIDDRGFQQLLRRVDTRELAVALKAASEEVKDKVFRNMSERAGEMLREEMEVLGPVRMKEVEYTQQVILKIVQEMETEGELIISRSGSEQYVE